MKPSHCGAPSVQPEGALAPLYLPRAAKHRAPEDWRDYPLPVPNDWHLLAAKKGFRIDRRLRDRLHLALECLTCGAQTAQKVYTLRTAQPVCGGCQERAREMTAATAGFVYLGSDPDDSHYGLYRLPCGHIERRQAHRLRLIAAGEVPEGHQGYHCAECYRAKLGEDAAARGWSLVGSDPKGDANYRLYEHGDGCGFQQRVAIANMQTGRFTCDVCADDWSTSPNALYLSRFRVPGHGRFVKLGHSKDPVSRHRFQLGLAPDTEVALLHVVPVETGKRALLLEKGQHKYMRQHHPDLVIPRATLDGWICVTSEIYAAEAEPILRRALEGIEARLAAKAALRRGTGAGEGGSAPPQEPA